jgi:signal transduction histidine kinase
MRKLRRRLRLPRRRPATAWVLAIVGPMLITLAALPFRSRLEGRGFLSCTLLVVVAAAMLGGSWPALTTVAVAFLSATYFFTAPYGSLRVDDPVQIVALIAFVVVGGSIGLLVDRVARIAEEQTALRRVEAALRRVATLVARAAPADEMFAVVTEEVGRLIAADGARMGHFESEGTVTFVAAWSRTGDPFPVGRRWTLAGENISALVQRSGRPARIDDFAGLSGPLAAYAREKGVRSTAGAPIIVDGRLWGVMVADSSSRPLHADSEAHLADFTDLVATAIANAEVRAELTASRMRIVAAADQTRRRIERDLHDGIQQRLVTLALGLTSTIESVPGALPELTAELAHTERGLQEVLEEVREISRGLHPAILSQAGLGPALKALARRSRVPVELEVRVDGRLLASIEAAAYYVVSEALTNTAKHAAASVAKVSVEQHDGLLRIQVSDDGVGGADPKGGTGLVGLTDRVEALGGRIAISSPSSAGTTIVAELPT